MHTASQSKIDLKKSISSKYNNLEYGILKECDENVSKHFGLQIIARIVYIWMFEPKYMVILIKLK